MKMATVNQLKHDSQFKNYISSLTALHVTGDCLVNFTENGLKSVHQQITATLGILPRCNQNCSQVFRQTRRWCHTCTQWRHELLKCSIQPAKIVWKKLNSYNWPNGFAQLAEVFVPSGWSNAGINLHDLSTQMNIWIYCSEFPRNITQLAIDIKNERNRIAHSSLKLTNNEKQKTFQSIENILLVPDIVQTIPNYPVVQQEITELKQNDLYQHETSMTMAVGAILTAVNTGNNKQTLDLYKLNSKFKKLKNEIRRKASWKNPPTLIQAALLVVGLALLVYTIWPPQNGSGLHMQHTVFEEGCLPETMHTPVKHGIALSGYLSYHKQLVGREQILSNLETDLWKNTDRNGVILSADMGYGKTALMVHIICATKEQKGFGIRKQLLAYHICRFDVSKTKQSHIFIYRILSFVLHKVKNFRIVHECQDYLERDECRDDKFGCIDQCLLFPLRKLNNPKPGKPIIIIIDALDECDDILTGENAIEHILKHRMAKFPKWIKFIITTRPKYISKEFESNFKSIYLRSDDSNNIQDITEYMKMSSLNDSISVYKDHGWNFQLITSVAEANLLEFTEIPNSLSLAYEQRFEEVFNKDYENAKTILEIFCTTFKTATPEMLWKIISSVTSINRYTFDKTMDQLMLFIKYIEGGLHFGHMSLKRWLEENENTKYQISISHGHQQLATFLFNQINANISNINLLDLAIHTSRSHSEIVRKNFKELSSKTLYILEEFQTENIIHRLARNVDDIEVCELLIIHFKDLNKLNKVGSSAAFVAAALGHKNTFSCLLEHGADINFRKSGIPSVIGLSRAVDMAFEHTHWGYGLLDIAAQNKRTNIVKFILQTKNSMNSTLFNKWNDLNLLPIHLACKYGHNEIVKELGSAFRWMLDNRCLYYAAGSGNIELAKYLIKAGVKDDCKQCNTSLYWLPSNSTRIQGRKCCNNKIGEIPEEYLFDDWDLIVCETALHKAIKENKTAVAKLVMDNNLSILQCRDRGGRIPVISAIQYDRQEIGTYIMRKSDFRVNETCIEIAQLSELTYLGDEEIHELQHYHCTPGTMLAHVAAKFGRLWFFEAINELKLMNSSNTDLMGCHPIHYAACHDHIHVIQYYKEIINSSLDIYNLKCSNGSLPVHSAAICNRVESVQFIMENCSTTFLNSTEKMSIALQVVSRNIDMVAAESIFIQTNSSILFGKLITGKHQIVQLDNNGRTIYHLAVANGHFQVINKLFAKYPFTSEKCLSIQDTFSVTPLDLAIDGIKRNKNIRFHIETVFMLPYLKYYEQHLLDYLTAKEYSIYKTLEFLKQTNQGVTCLPRNTVNTLIEKLSYPLVPLLLYNNMVGQKLTDLKIVNILSTMIIYDHTRIMTLDFIHASMFKFKPKLICGQPLQRSFYHLIVLYYFRIIHDLRFGNMLEEAVNNVLCIGFRYLSQDDLSNCYDKDGFNVLERSIQGSNIILTKCLISLNVVSKTKIKQILRMPENVGLKYDNFGVILNFTKSVGDSIELTITEKKNDTSFIDRQIKREISVVDNATSALIGIYSKQITQTIICRSDSKYFSLVHIWAMENMRKTLETVTTIYGVDILKCKNIDNFTTLYLAKMFDSINTVDYLESQNVSLVKPLVSAEKIFIHKMQSRFYFNKSRHSALSCLFKYNVFNNFRQSYSTYKCLKKASKVLTSSHSVENGRQHILEQLKWRLIFFSNIELLMNIKNLYLPRVIRFHNFWTKLLFLNKQVVFSFTIKWIKKICYLIAKSFVHVLKDSKDSKVCKDKRYICKLQYESVTDTLNEFYKHEPTIYECLNFIASDLNKNAMMSRLRKSLAEYRTVFQLSIVAANNNYMGQYFNDRYINMWNRYQPKLLTSKDWYLYQTRYKYMNVIQTLQSYNKTFMYQNGSLTLSKFSDATKDVHNEIMYSTRTIAAFTLRREWEDKKDKN